VFERAAYRLTGLMNRWSSATPTACCGACKPCVTEAATNLVVVATGVGLEAANARRGNKPTEVEEIPLRDR
jgi:hypothetical protein